MDRVKAIKVLKPLIDSYVDYANISMKEEDDDIVEALEMAVEALDVPDTNVGDMIDRQAALDIYDDYNVAVENGELEAYGKHRKRLLGLSSAQPATNCSGIPNGSDDTISRQAALDAIKAWRADYPLELQEPIDDCWNSVRELPAVQPEIIRCKDCKYWRDDHTCHEHSLVSPMCANEHCSRAERRRNEHID